MRFTVDSETPSSFAAFLTVTLKVRGVGAGVRRSRTRLNSGAMFPLAVSWFVM